MQEEKNEERLFNFNQSANPMILTNSSNRNYFKCLALQIYLAEMEAEDYFVELTSYPLHKTDIIFSNSGKTKRKNESTTGEKEYELTSELITPPNQVIGKYEKVR